MPNFSAEERRALSGEELELATQSRQPQLGKLSDGELATLISRLRAARDKARGRGNRQAREARGKADPAGAQPASGNAGTVEKEKFLAAALRRANIEQKRRQSDAAQVAGKAADAAQQVRTEASTPDVKPAEPAAKTPGIARKPATRSNAAARGARAKAAAQPTDRRGSGARKVAKPKAAAAPEAPATEAPVVQPAPQAKPAPKVTPAVGKAPRTKPAAPAQSASEPTAGPADSAPSPTALVKELTDKAARRSAVAEKAQGKVEKAAKRAEKLGDKKSRKALEKAEEKARKAHRKARKTVRQARKAAADLS